MDSRIAFVLSVLLESANAKSVPVFYGLPTRSVIGKPALYIAPSGFFGNGYGTGDSLPKLTIQSIEGVPLLFGMPIIEKTENVIVVKADIIASAFFLLTRYEEWVRREVRDQHGRFPGKESLPFRAGFLNRPVVDEYRILLRKWLREAGIDLPEPKREFRVVLTHDVDVPFAFPRLRSSIKPTVRLLVEGDSGCTKPLLAWAGLGKDPNDTFDWIIDQDNAFCAQFGADLSKVIYFLMAPKDGNHESTYDIRSRRTRRLIQRLVSSKAQVGLHASYAAGGEPELVGDERENLESVLGQCVRSSRHHFLRWREPEHVAALEKAGITDDYTLGYADQAGFRLGTCHPFHLFDLKANRETNVTAHPMIIMECTLDRPQYMGLDYENALQTCRIILAAVKRVKGEAVLLWHNTEFMENGKNTGYHRRLYPAVLAGLLTDNWTSGLHETKTRII